MRLKGQIVNYSILCALMLAIMTSCTAPLYFEKTEPPEISTEITPCRIAFVNIFDYTRPEAVKAQNQTVYRSAVNKFGAELGKIGSTDSLFRFLVADTLFKGIPVQNQTVTLPADTVVMLTTAFQADYLLTLDSLSLFLQEDESESEEAAITFNDFYLVGDFFLSLYSLSGDLVNRSEVTVSSRSGSRSVLSYISGGPGNFSRTTEQAGSLGIDAADEYADRYYPVKTQQQSYVYTGRKFREANDLIVKEEFDKAAGILKKLALSPHPGLSYKAEHNLDVLNEVRNSTPQNPGKK